MDIVKHAAAGTLESSDVFIAIEPADDLEVDIESVVKNQYAEAIEATVYEMLRTFGVKSGSIKINDRGALDCVIRARMETVIKRGAGK